MFVLELEVDVCGGGWSQKSKGATSKTQKPSCGTDGASVMLNVVYIILRRCANITEGRKGKSSQQYVCAILIVAVKGLYNIVPNNQRPLSNGDDI